jgi:hypothetical protein
MFARNIHGDLIGFGMGLNVVYVYHISNNIRLLYIMSSFIHAESLCLYHLLFCPTVPGVYIWIYTYIGIFSQYNIIEFTLNFSHYCNYKYPILMYLTPVQQVKRTEGLNLLLQIKLQIIVIYFWCQHPNRILQPLLIMTEIQSYNFLG